MARRRRRDAARRRGRCNNDDTTTTRTKRAASLRKASKGQGSNRALDTRVPISVRANNDATRRDYGADEFRPAASRRPRALPRPRAAPSTVFARSITPRRAFASSRRAVHRPPRRREEASASADYIQPSPSCRRRSRRARIRTISARGYEAAAGTPTAAPRAGATATTGTPRTAMFAASEGRRRRR